MDDLFLFVFTRIASTEGLLLVIGGICVVLFLRHRRQKLFKLLLATAGLIVSVQLVKNFFQIARPEGAFIETSGYAFPSGHAAGSLFLALVICSFASQLSSPLRYGVYIAAGLAALTIGISRMHFGVHTPFQIAVGFLFGAVWAGAYIWTTRKR